MTGAQWHAKKCGNKTHYWDSKKRKCLSKTPQAAKGKGRCSQTYQDKDKNRAVNGAKGRAKSKCGCSNPSIKVQNVHPRGTRAAFWGGWSGCIAGAVGGTAATVATGGALAGAAAAATAAGCTAAGSVGMRGKTSFKVTATCH